MIDWSRGKCAYPSAKLTDHAHGPIASPAGILNATTIQITQTPLGRFVRNPSEAQPPHEIITQFHCSLTR